MRSDRARFILLILAAMVFLGIAIGSVISPQIMAAQLGYNLDNIDAINEFRAVYVGVWAATSILMIVAARQINLAIVGDLGAILILGQSFGRTVSFILDGLPSEKIWPVYTLELLAGLALLLIRPCKVELEDEAKN